MFILYSSIWDGPRTDKIGYFPLHKYQDIKEKTTVYLCSQHVYAFGKLTLSLENAGFNPLTF